jgi:hypothetical protein
VVPPGFYREPPMWSHPVALCSDNGLFRGPLLSKSSDLGDPLPGGFPILPVKGLSAGDPLSLRPFQDGTLPDQHFIRSI